MSDLFFLPILARDLIGFYFIFIAVWNIYHWKPVFNVMLDKRIPHPFLILPIAIGWEAIAGGMIMANLYVDFAAFSLVFLVLLSVIFFQDFWNHQGEARKHRLILFMTNITMTLGALLLLIALEQV